ncbi:oxidoreductase [Akanthomyces lecanii RCEF 1005]|uniref:Oxidoreductase n=1 Tax=Akanthomyces lecanii RCEF 1005 TaxID=1081108 RepID=A0A168JC70_CORDF|nr:oxidoreductase [Akanthomyces lecanii RCEF 1005]
MTLISGGDEYPVSTKRIARIAAQLSALPLELIEPVLAELPLYHILQLHCASTAGISLHDAIRISPTWAWLFQHHGERLAALWIAANRLSMLWCGRDYMQMTTVKQWSESSVKLHCQAVTSKPEDPASHTLGVLEKQFTVSLMAFLGDDRQVYPPGFRIVESAPWGRGLKMADRRAACMYLPAPLLSSLIKEKQLPESFKKMRTDAFSASDFTSSPPSLDFLDQAADALHAHQWTYQDAMLVLPWIIKALEMLRKTQSDELIVLAQLLDDFPELLKMPLAPQLMEPTRLPHIARNLRMDARKASHLPIYARLKKIHYGRQKLFVGRSWFRFRYAHCCLVPYNWCFDLFSKFRDTYDPTKNDPIIPSEMLPLFNIAELGFNDIYSYSSSSMSRVARMNGQTCFVFRPDQNVSLPARPKELEWLTAFIKCVNWIRSQFPGEYQASYTNALVSSLPVFSKSASRATMDAVDYEEFVHRAPVSEIATQLQTDSKICDGNNRKVWSKQPSLLALYISALTPLRKQELLQQMFPSRELGPETRTLIFESVLQKVVSVLQSNPLSGDCSSPEDGMSEADAAAELPSSEGQQASAPQNKMTSDEELRVCERILENLLLTKDDQDGSIHRVLSEVRSKINQDKGVHANIKIPSYSPASNADRANLAVCYICRLRRHESHPFLPALCKACGDFNLSASRMSLPRNLQLRGRTALVTGGRVNLGFHTALRLLRCGAFVIISTRYPADAVMRYRREADSETWEARLKIIGADFRSATDAMALTRQVKNILDQNSSILDILINNAAQTLTDSKEAEVTAINRERDLLGDSMGSCQALWLQSTPYTPRLRGATDSSIETASFTGLLESQDIAAHVKSTTSVVPYSKSSWVQSLHEIPYEDLISAHSVNTFVPLILIRELLPVMRRKEGAGDRCGYIVNVSSREGIFENRKGHSAKRGKHVHTNMSKAALNMITETQAAEAWEKYGVAMNTVDPGYMSAAPEFEDSFGGERPIGWGDGAGRVLWPIAIGQKATSNGKGKVIWGQFLKHYGAVRVEPGFGRG